MTPDGNYRLTQMNADFKLKTPLVNPCDRGYQYPMVAPEDIIEKKWLDWYRLTPMERWARSCKMLEEYIAAGGSLDPEYDPESPFNDCFYDENGRLRH
jgi:hypothetical protein